MPKVMVTRTMASLSVNRPGNMP
uniref:Calnexin n=1 Tax=Arundo donax TaxID=35708 RepID=A0A0A9CYH8_ARUDO